jgi:hypothetical protein
MKKQAASLTRIRQEEDDGLCAFVLQFLKGDRQIYGGGGFVPIIGCQVRRRIWTIIRAGGGGGRVRAPERRSTRCHYGAGA